MKLLCTHSYYARHYKELLEFVKNPEDIILISDHYELKPPSFEYFVIDSDAGSQIASFGANLGTFFIENTHQIANQVEYGVNVQARTSILNLPQFRLKTFEEDK